MSKISVKWRQCPMNKLRTVWEAWQKEYAIYYDEESLVQVNRQWLKGNFDLLVDENLLLAETLKVGREAKMWEKITYEEYWKILDDRKTEFIAGTGAFDVVWKDQFGEYVAKSNGRQFFKWVEKEEDK